MSGIANNAKTAALAAAEILDENNPQDKGVQMKKLAESGLLSDKAVVTPVANDKAEVSNLTWRTDLNVLVDGYGKVFGKTLKQTYGTADAAYQARVAAGQVNDAETRARETVDNARSWAIVSIANKAGTSYTTYLLVYDGTNVWRVGEYDYTSPTTYKGIGRNKVDVTGSSGLPNIDGISYYFEAPKA